MMATKSFIRLNVYRCHGGRVIYYAAARLRRDLDADNNNGDGGNTAIGHCVVFF